jgi:hypothetical protein
MFHMQLVTAVQRMVLFDRVHGYWSCLGSSQLRPEELEPARSERLLRGNVSPFAAVVAARQLHELETRRSAVHKQFIARVEGYSQGQQHAAGKGAKVSVRGLPPVAAIAEGFEQSSGASTQHAEHCACSDDESLRAAILCVLPDEAPPSYSFPEPKLNSATSSQQPGQRFAVFTERDVAPYTCTPKPRQAMWFPEQSNRGHAPRNQQGTDHDEGSALAESQERNSNEAEPSTQVILGTAHPPSTSSPAEPQTKKSVGGYLLASWTASGAAASAGGWRVARRSDVGGAVGLNKSAVTSIHQRLQRSKAIPRSPLLTLPPDMEISEGWTVTDEVELAASGQEFLDRFGESSLFSLHH